jgi:hypothetical protein
MGIVLFCLSIAMSILTISFVLSGFISRTVEQYQDYVASQSKVGQVYSQSETEPRSCRVIK